MKEKYYYIATLILTTIFVINLPQTIYAEGSLSADTPFVK